MDFVYRSEITMSNGMDILNSRNCVPFKPLPATCIACLTISQLGRENLFILVNRTSFINSD